MTLGKKEDILTKVEITDQLVEQVDLYKYLGTVFDNKLNFTANVDILCKKGMQRLHYLRKLKSFNSSVNVLELVYNSIIYSVISFNSVTWYGILTQSNITKLNRINRLACKITGLSLPTIEEAFVKSIKRNTDNILKDSSHPLFDYFCLLPSGKRPL